MKGCQKRKQKTIILSNAGLAGTGWETWRVGSNPTPVYFESNHGIGIPSSLFLNQGHLLIVCGSVEVKYVSQLVYMFI